MDLAQITPVILTFNEAANIGRTLAPLQWARRVIVLDSGSTDDTAEHIQKYQNVAFSTRLFDTHAEQWNAAVQKSDTEWVLALDADYLTSGELSRELAMLEPNANQVAFFARFVYCVFGRPLRASLYPPRAVLFRPSAARYVQDGHTQLLRFEGATGFLQNAILHDDRKSLSRWLQMQQRYAGLEATHLRETKAQKLNSQDRVRKFVVIAPVIVPIYLLLVRGLLFDGLAGLYYVLQRIVAELMLSLHLLKPMLTRRNRGDRVADEA